MRTLARAAHRPLTLTPAADARPYIVLVDDNFHVMDEDERIEAGRFATAEEALAAARGIVEASLAHLHKPGMNAEKLYDAYTGFGDDPFMRGKPPVPFSPWDYAKARCVEICGEG